MSDLAILVLASWVKSTLFRSISKHSFYLDSSNHLIKVQVISAISP